MMTKKHYEAIAASVRRAHLQHQGFNIHLRPVQSMSLYAGNIADYFASENPRFDRARFLKACGVED